MKSHKKDIIFIVIMAAAAVIAGILFWQKNNPASGQDYIEITVDGEVFGTYPLDRDQEIVVSTSYGNNTVIIENGAAYVKEADCPDKICAGMPPVSKEGEIICCLPHHLFLTAYYGK